jgi:hypothetical protein
MNTRQRRELWLKNIGCIEPLAGKAYICPYHFVTGKIKSMSRKALEL